MPERPPPRGGCAKKPGGSSPIMREAPIFTRGQIIFAVILLIAATLMAFCSPARTLEIPSECLIRSDTVCRIPAATVRAASKSERQQALDYLKANGITYRIMYEKRKAVGKAKVSRPSKVHARSQKPRPVRRASHRARDTPLPTPSPSRAAGGPVPRSAGPSAETATPAQAPAPAVAPSENPAPQEPSAGTPAQGLPEGKGEPPQAEPVKPSSGLVKAWDWLRSLPPPNKWRWW